MRNKNSTLVVFVIILSCIAISCEKDPHFEEGLYEMHAGKLYHKIQITPLKGDETFTVNGVSFTMKPVEGGYFQMGSNYGSEKPVHSVSVSSFYMGETEVTQALWEAVMGSYPSGFEGDDLPVEKVSWDDCQEFVQKLSQLTGRTFRLPTEAEWEYAARGGKYHSGYKYAGSNDINYVAWCFSNSGSKTHAVATKQPNALGLYDMSGNAWEWCSDWYGSYSGSAQANPTGPSSGSYRVIRGGSWLSDARYCRVSARENNTPYYRYDFIGFRLAMVLDIPTNAATEEIIASMVFVEGGTFQMGATSEQASEADDDEKPVHSVTVSDFYMGKTEVTQRQWKAIMGSNPSGFEGDDLPVENVSWNDCQEFVQKLNQLTGKTFRLPTEAEWEYAARGGKYHSGYKYAGSNNINDVAWCSSNSGSKTHAVATKQPNALGLYDMSGNVGEWCSDWYSSDYYSVSPSSNPQGPSSGSHRVLRGGSWNNIDGNCRVSYRNNGNPDLHYYLVGFRLVMVP